MTPELAIVQAMVNVPTLQYPALRCVIVRPEAVNLPGWRWAMITKVALDRLSRSLHSDVCDSDGLRDAAIHSTISGSGGRRDCAASYSIQNKLNATRGCSKFMR